MKESAIKRLRLNMELVKRDYKAKHPMECIFPIFCNYNVGRDITLEYAEQTKDKKLLEIVKKLDQEHIDLLNYEK